MIQFFVKTILALVFLMTATQVSLAQSEPDTLAPVTLIPPADQLHYMEDTTHWMIEIPLWIPGLRGALAYGDINIEIGGSGGDGGGDGGSSIIKDLFNSDTKLDYFMVGRIKYRWDRLYIDADIYGGKIDNSVTFVYYDQTLLETKIELIIGRAQVGYTFIDHPFRNEKAGRIRSFGVVGFQLSYGALDAILPEPIEAIHAHNTWIDPFFGIGLNYDIYKLSLGSSFDLGFRGISTFSNWWFKSQARYRFGPRISMELGWIMTGIGGTKDLADEELLLEISLNGPVAGIAFHF